MNALPRVSTTGIVLGAIGLTVGTVLLVDAGHDQPVSFDRGLTLGSESLRQVPSRQVWAQEAQNGDGVVQSFKSAVATAKARSTVPAFTVSRLS